MSDQINLDKDLDLIADTVVKLNGHKQISDFLEDLLTKEEIIDLAQRLKIAKSILGDKTYDQITDKVNTSSATVSRIGQAIKYGKGSFAKIFKSHK